MVNWLAQTFPGLSGSRYQIKSPRTKHYNCIAWAAGDSTQWWWPVSEAQDAYWPPYILRAETVSAFREAFMFLGYADCDSDVLDPAFEKVAIFADEKGIPLHAARLLPNGAWTSKLGELEDIEHELHGLEGSEYGKVVLIMKRPLPGH